MVQVEGICEGKKGEKQKANSILGREVYTSESSLNLLPSASGQGKEWELIVWELQNNNNNEKWIVNSFLKKKKKKDCQIIPSSSTGSLSKEKPRPGEHDL